MKLFPQKIKVRSLISKIVETVATSNIITSWLYNKLKIIQLSVL